MKRLLFLCSCLTLLHPGISRGHKDGSAEALHVLERVTGQATLPITLTVKTNPGRNGEKTYFRYKVEDGVLKVEGSNPVALCRGVYDYVKANHLGMCSWAGTNITLPARLENTEEKHVASPFEHHYYFNVCTYGYTMPYWDWERWEKEIDRMALHGIDMPLALTAYEAIIARVWRKMGLTDEEINSYFVGPAHLPWMRMGNISGIDGPLDEDWHRGQIELQHRILARMKALGMKPVCPGFPGFVPQAFKRLHPELELIQTHWGGAFCNWMVPPQDPLFMEIGVAFIREWEKEFGKNEYYLVDSFNEMDIPFPAKGNKERYELLASYGDKVYRSIRKGNPQATWVMQGWMFGYQRHIWDYETLGALLSKVPDDKMLLLDLAADYNKNFWHSEANWEYYKGFYGKPWVYSVIPNMGGKTGMTGILEFYANGHLEALNSPNRGRLTAHGMAPEGLENNEVIYELLCDAGWSATRIDLKEWLKEYFHNRYGHCPEAVLRCGNLLLESVYGTFTDHPRYNWQLRPGTVQQGSINLSESFFKAIESFVEASDRLQDSPLYMADLAELTALYLGGKAELLVRAIDRQYEMGDTARAEKLEGDFAHLLLGMDALLSTHPYLRLEQWLDYARKHARTPAQSLRYERNAKRIVTVWGPPVDDYSARVWSGLLRDYYLPRWKHFFQSRKTGKPFDFAQWEKDWVESGTCSTATVPTDPVNTARALMDYAAFITPALIPDTQNGRMGSWTVAPGKTEDLSIRIQADMLKAISAIRISKSKGDGTITCSDIKLVADGTVMAADSAAKSLEEGKSSLVRPITLPDDIRGNNGVELCIRIKNNGTENTSGHIYIITE